MLAEFCVTKLRRVSETGTSTPSGPWPARRRPRAED
jgi:hypothetical protein